MADGTIIVCNTNSSHMILNFSTKQKSEDTKGAMNQEVGNRSTDNTMTKKK